jgi:hypothetical protein
MAESLVSLTEPRKSEEELEYEYDSGTEKIGRERKRDTQCRQTPNIER